MDRRQFLMMGGLVTAGVAMSGTTAFAEWRPRRPINLIVPYKAGGGTDSFGRAVAAVAEKALPVPVVIVNKPGSSGITGATEASRSRPDGSTMMLTSTGSFLLTSMLRDTDVTPLDSFRIVAQVGKLTTSLVVPANSPFQTVADLVDHATANPGSLRWAHTGRGGFHHVAGQGFLDSNGLETVDVPFKGGSATRAAVIGGQVDFGFMGIQQTAGFEKEMRALALNDDKRDAFKTDVPTFEELGFQWVPVTSPIVVFAPKDTPDDVVVGMQEAVRKMTELPEFAEAMAQRGNAPAFKTGADAEALIRDMKTSAEPIIAALKQ